MLGGSRTHVKQDSSLNFDFTYGLQAILAQTGITWKKEYWKKLR